MQLKKKNKITASAPSDIKRYYGLKRMQELSSTEACDDWYPFGQKGYLP